MSTRMVRNGKDGVYDVIWGWLAKVAAGTIITLLTASILGLYNVASEVRSLREELMRTRLDIMETKEQSKLNGQALAAHLLEVERLKALYVTRVELDAWWDRRSRNIVTVDR